uniref:G-protein coupled receptors family 1 profile domain-containing protein n=1 Tax=Eptatretus burgeri TaxID=7764 RepID=A0A8C4X159_EPTBU
MLANYIPIGGASVIYTTSKWLSLPLTKIFVLLLFSSIMFISVFINLGVIAACFYRRFNSPMLLYIALASIADTSWGIVGISCFLNSTIASRQEISFSECLLQLFCIHISNFQQSLTMWLMYVDRHWAVFYPYSYVALIVNKGGALKFATLVWTIGFVSFVFVTTQLKFCKHSLTIDDAICSFLSLSKSACGNINFPATYTLSALLLILGLTGCTAMFSTLCIIRKCRKSSAAANIKALSTCFTQLFVLLTYFMSLGFIFALKKITKHTAVNFIMNLSVVITPATLNPLIFGLRTQEIRLLFIRGYSKLRSVQKQSSQTSVLTRNSSIKMQKKIRNIVF